MAVRIEVTQGPDAGWSFVVQTREARIGRGGSNHIRMRDPSWPDGHLVLVNRQGGWLIVNRMPNGVYLDAQVVEPGQQATWYEGGLLQPTGATLMRLVSHEGPVQGTQPVVILAPGSAKTAPQMWQYMFIAGCVALAVFMILQNSPNKVPTRENDKMAKEVEDTAKDPVLGPAMAQVQMLLNDARIFETRNKKPEAFRCLREAREQIERILREDVPVRLKGDEREAYRQELERMSLKVGNQIIVLDRKLQTK